MSEFRDEVEKGSEVEDGEVQLEGGAVAALAVDESAAALTPATASEPALSISRLNFDAPLALETAVNVVYCGVCSLPCEYCIYGQRYEECKAWRSGLDEDTLSSLLGCASLESTAGGGKKGGIGPKKKAVSSVACKVIIVREQRQKRKYITSIIGLDTVPDLKVKDAAKSFGKKFSSGCSVSETATGAKEVVIQVRPQ